MPPLNKDALQSRLSQRVLALIGSLGLTGMGLFDSSQLSSSPELVETSYHDASSLSSGPIFSSRQQCPLDLPFSCTNTTDMDVDLCCFEYPGGVVLQTQFWDYKPATGPNDSFTLHGLWPDNCDGSFEQFCDNSMEISDPVSIIEQHDRDLLDTMHKYWKDFKGNDAYLWKHEWNKHGTCYSTLKPSCYGNQMSAYNNVVDYFNQSVALFTSLPTYDWLVEAGITPSETATYTKSQILEALTSKFGAEPYIRCDTTNALQEVWYFHHLRGSLVGGDYLPIDTLTTSRCKSDGIRFPPKVPGLNPTQTHTVPGPSPTDPTVKGHIRLSGQQGCLIRNGHWYTSGACAGYSLIQLETGSVNLKSSGGYCTIHEGGFICAHNVQPFEFEYDQETGIISANGQSTFSADAIPRGRVQQKIMLGHGQIDFNLKFSMN